MHAIKATVILAIVLMFASNDLCAQNVNLNEYDVFSGDTLIDKQDLTLKYKTLDTARLHALTFKPITDGVKKFYYLNGNLASTGEIKNGKENGPWTIWHENGNKAREGTMNEGKATGIHTYWFASGSIRSVGSFVDGKFEGKWTMYREDGTETVDQYYRDGQLVEKSDYER